MYTVNEFHLFRLMLVVFFSSGVLGSVIPDIFRQNLHTLAHLDAAMQ